MAEAAVAATTEGAAQAALSTSGAQPDTTAADNTAKPNGSNGTAPATIAAAIDADADADTAAEEAKPVDDGWGDKWRDRIIKADPKAAKALARIQSPEGMWTKIKNLEKRLNEKAQGPAKPADDATDEEKAEYRKAIGLPDKPELYIENAKLPDGRVIGDEDKPVAESFAKAVFGADYSQKQYDQALAWYYDRMEAVQSDQIEEDLRFKTDSLVELKAEMGADFKRNINALPILFKDAPDGLFDQLMSARDANGHKLGDNPGFLRFMSGLALEMNPAASIVPAGVNGAKGMEARIAEIDKIMRDDARTYWRDEAMQSEYRDLLAARDKLQARKA